VPQARGTKGQPQSRLQLVPCAVVVKRAGVFCHEADTLVCSKVQTWPSFCAVVFLVDVLPVARKNIIVAKPVERTVVMPAVVTWCLELTVESKRTAHRVQLQRIVNGVPVTQQSVIHPLRPALNVGFSVMRHTLGVCVECDITFLRVFEQPGECCDLTQRGIVGELAHVVPFHAKSARIFHDVGQRVRVDGPLHVTLIAANGHCETLGACEQMPVLSECSQIPLPHVIAIDGKHKIGQVANRYCEWPAIPDDWQPLIGRAIAQTHGRFGGQVARTKIAAIFDFHRACCADIQPALSFLLRGSFQTISHELERGLSEGQHVSKCSPLLFLATAFFLSACSRSASRGNGCLWKRWQLEATLLHQPAIRMHLGHRQA